MRVVYFAEAAQRTGCREEEWEIHEPLSLEDFWREAVRRHPALAGIKKHSRIASGGEYVDAEGQVNIDQEAAVIPPVSGG